MTTFPTGTVTLLFTDIEGSTQLLQRLGVRYDAVLAEYRALLRAVFATHGGQEVDTQGDSFFVAFPSAVAAVQAAVASQRALAAHPWPEGVSMATRMGVHTGEPRPSTDGYVGLDVHRAARIGAVGHGGQVLLSTTTHALVVHELPDGVSSQDLGPQRLKDLQHAEHIFQLLIAGLRGDFPPLTTLDARPNNLPLQSTPFIGRTQDLEQVRRRLRDPTVRLVTLTGTGGTGKTRLALQVAAELLAEFADGVCFVDLALISDPALVLTTIATTLNVKETGTHSLLDILRAFLRQRQLLLVLDNCEQILPALPVIDDLLRGAPRLTVLATSRSVLGVYGEHDVQVPALALPDVAYLPAVDHLLHYDAVRLFVERAQAAKADFVLTSTNAAAVVAICQRLDGLPLAIELAAARVRLLPPPALLDRLSNRLQLLRGGARTLPRRQQTLRGMIDWSYNLLSAGEQRLFRRLAVFVGGRTVAAAEAVCAFDGGLELDVLDGLQSLLDQSLLREGAGPEGEPRFTMLETIREYALEQLATSGEGAALTGRHAAYYLALAEAAEPAIRGADAPAWLDRLEADYDNLRAALAHGPPETVARLSAALAGFWILRDHLREGAARLEAAVGVSDGLPSRVRANVRYAAGMVAKYQEDNVRAQAHFTASLALYRALGEPSGIARVLGRLGEVLAFQDQHEQAQPHFAESLALAQGIGDRRRIAWAMLGLGWVAHTQGDVEQCSALYAESMALFRAVGDRLGTAWAVIWPSRVATSAGNYALAEALLQEQLAAERALNHALGIAAATFNLATTALAEGNHAKAAAWLAESLRLWRELGTIPRFREMVAVLESFASQAGARGQAARAGRLFGAGDALRETYRETYAATLRVLPEEQWTVRPEYEREVAAARAQLGADAWAAAWAEGRAMPLEQAIAYALAEAEN